MSEHRVAGRSRDTGRGRPPAELFRGVYRQAYDAIVQPGRVWTAGKYFLRRWSAYLSPPEMWLVIGARQLSYLNKRRPWFAAYDSTLAAAAGVNVDVYRRSTKRAIAEQKGAIALFLSKEGDPQYVVRGDTPRKGRTRYNVRLDDPLTPADAAALAEWLAARLGSEADEVQLVAALEEGRRLEPQRLWADDLRLYAGATPEDEVSPDEVSPDEASSDEALADETAADITAAALTVEEVVVSLLPHLAEQGQGEGGWRAAAGALQAHLVAGELLHLEPQYFREKWLPKLGAGPALLVVALRSLCFYNEESGEIRDVVRVEANALAQQLQTSTRNLRRWFKKVDKAAAHDSLFGPFFTYLDSEKQPDQTVLTSYRVNLKMPLTATDLAHYLAEIGRHALQGEEAAREPVTRNGDTDKKSVTDSGAIEDTDKKSVAQVSSESRSDKKSVTSNGVTDKLSVVNGGGGQIGGNGSGGDGRKVGPSATNGRPVKYYERLLSILNLQTFNQLERKTEQQYQHLWHVRDELAQAPLAVVVGGGSLQGLLDRLGIQEPARGRLLAQEVDAAEMLGWFLYAQGQASLEQPVGYVVARALAGDTPPPPYRELAALTWEQWRTYAALAAVGPAAVGLLPGFEQWLAQYGETPPEELPFGVGMGLRDLPGAPESAPAEANGAGFDAATSPEQAANARLWQEALDELALQMTQATFDAWLRGARFVARDGETWTIGVANDAARAWLESRLSRVVERTLGVVVGGEVEVRFVVGD